MSQVLLRSRAAWQAGRGDFMTLAPESVRAATAYAEMTVPDAAAWQSEIASVLATVDHAVVVVDRQWRVRQASPAACRQAGRTREQTLGRLVWEAFPQLRGVAVEGRCEQAAADGEPFEAATFSEPEQRWFEVRAQPFTGGLAIGFRDVTGEHRAEEVVRQSQQLEVLGRLTGGIAHDINNLLTVILGNLEMLAMQAEDSEPPRLDELELLQAGLGAGQTASELMRRLLTFSRRQSLSPRALDLAALLAALQPLLRQTLGETVRLHVDCAPDLWAVLADRPGLESVLLNMALNSRDAMPRGGAFTLASANVHVAEPQRAALGLDRPGDYVTVVATDTGQGMSPDVLERVFEPFFTTKAPGSGTGLGLSMAYGFAKQSNGLISVSSSPGEGTAVTLFLPRTRQPPEPEPSQGGAARMPVRGARTILLVEDHELVRVHTAALLGNMGYRVIQAADGRQAIDALEGGATPDLLLTDVVMAGEYNGRELADVAVRLRPGLPVLFMSGYPGAVLLENGRLPPDVDLLAKPFRPRELADRVAARLDGGPVS